MFISLGKLQTVSYQLLCRGARMYFGMSDHEGLSIPTSGGHVDGCARHREGCCGGSRDSGRGAFVLPANAGPILAAEAIHEVLNNDHLRWSLIHKGFQRAKELESRASSARTAELLLAAAQ
jgi:hypothetical protein